MPVASAELASCCSSVLNPAALDPLAIWKSSVTSSMRREERRKAGGGCRRQLHLPWCLMKSPLLPGQLTRQAPPFLMSHNFSRKMSTCKGSKGHKRTLLQWSRRPQTAKSSWLPLPWVRSVSFSATSVYCRDCSPQYPSGQEMMPVSLRIPVQLGVINSSLVFTLRIPFFQVFLAEEGKAQNRSNSIWIGSVYMCVCRQGRDAARPMALPGFK